MDNELDLLKKIKKVDTPPFLFTRIEQRLTHVEPTVVRLPVALLYAAIIAAVVLLNLSLMQGYVKPSQSLATENLVEQMNMYPSNQFYHE